MDARDNRSYSRDEFINSLSLRRIRVYIPCIYKNSKNGESFCQYISRTQGIKMAYANHITGKALIIFDENTIKEYELRAEISRIEKLIMSDLKSDKTCEYSKNEKTVKQGHNDSQWHMMDSRMVLQALNCDADCGLTKNTAQERIKKYGLNRLEDKKKKSILDMIIRQADDFTTRVLLGAGVVSMLFGSIGDGITILGIIAVEAILGISQQLKADKSIDGLKKLSAPSAKVIRDGKNQILPAKDLVPGDLILLESGDKVAADARIIENMGLEVNEALLTGEPFPVKKQNKTSEKDYEGIADRVNMLFMGTSVTNGRAKAVVVETGMNTQMGKIALMLQNVKEEPTPLEKKMHSFGKKLSTVCFSMCGLITLGGILRGRGIVEMISMGTALAIGAVPESLPAIVAITMAMGVQRMAKKNAIVRKLPAVETLGSATVICCDKTGTLTKNEMTVKQIYDGSSIYDVEGEGYDYEGRFLNSGNTVSIEKGSSLYRLLEYGSLCSNASLERMAKSWEVKGDPTEGSILIAAEKAGIITKEINKSNVRVREIPFDSERKMMSVGCRCSDQTLIITKGAVDSVLEVCSNIYSENETRPINNEDAERILKVNSRMSQNAYRVIAVACRETYDMEEDNPEIGLTFLGLFAMIDPPRTGVKESIKKCSEAGIKVVMITGDHPDTAKAIGKSVGLDGGMVISGRMLDSMSDEELHEKIDSINIFARTSPYHKLKIVKAFKKKGYVVAMTGDGVNDAPAIKEADIGISMGMGGTDVAKDASSIVLLDDNFTTIAGAVEEGRTVRYNIKKSMSYLLSGSFGEVLAILIGTLMGLPMPMTPTQLLYINLVTESITGASLSMEAPDPGIMRKRPEPVHEELITANNARDIALRGLGVGGTTLAAFVWSLARGQGLNKARTMAFTNLITTQLFNLYDCSNLQDTKAMMFKNTFRKWAVSLSAILTLGTIYLPALSGLFATVPLLLSDWLIIGGLAALSKYHYIARVPIHRRLPEKRYLLKDKH